MSGPATSRVYVPILVFLTLFEMFLPQSLAAYGDYLAGFSNPLGIEALAGLEDSLAAAVIDPLSIMAVLSLVIDAVTDLVIRWRRSVGVERLQIRAFALGGLAMILLFLGGGAMDRIVASRGCAPQFIRSDNGPELTANALRDWCRFTGAGSAYIEPGSPWENPYVESFGSRLRDELLTCEQFDTLLEAQVVISDWKEDYNHQRPHSSLGWKPQAVYAAGLSPDQPTRPS